MTGSGTERLEGATRGRPAGLGRIVAAVVVVAATGGFFAAGMAVGAGPGGVAEPHYPHDAISCQLQVVGNETPEHYEPGYHAGVETIGDIEPLRAPGPPAPGPFTQP